MSAKQFAARPSVGWAILVAVMSIAWAFVVFHFSIRIAVWYAKARGWLP